MFPVDGSRTGERSDCGELQDSSLARSSRRSVDPRLRNSLGFARTEKGFGEKTAWEELSQQTFNLLRNFFVHDRNCRRISVQNGLTFQSYARGKTALYVNCSFLRAEGANSPSFRSIEGNLRATVQTTTKVSPSVTRSGERLPKNGNVHRQRCPR